jgi:hypothetical protein
VNLNSLVRSEGTSDSFVFRKDSAGFGIPRNELGKLDKFSEHAIEKGTASTRVYMEVSSPAGARSQSASGNLAVTSMHRGSAPPPEMSSSQSGIQNGRGVSSNMSSSPSSMRSTSSSSSPAPSHK